MWGAYWVAGRLGRGADDAAATANAALTERIVERPSEIYDIEVESVGRGIEVRLEIAAQRMAGLQERRRSLAGRTGCGLCGVDSLDAALRPVPAVSDPRPVARSSIERAMAVSVSKRFLLSKF